MYRCNWYAAVERMWSGLLLSHIVHTNLDMALNHRQELLDLLSHLQSDTMPLVASSVLEELGSFQRPAQARFCPPCEQLNYSQTRQLVSKRYGQRSTSQYLRWWKLLFRSASLLLCNDESCHLQLHLQTAASLCNSMQHYANIVVTPVNYCVNFMSPKSLLSSTLKLDSSNLFSEAFECRLFSRGNLPSGCACWSQKNTGQDAMHQRCTCMAYQQMLTPWSSWFIQCANEGLRLFLHDSIVPIQRNERTKHDHVSFSIMWSTTLSTLPNAVILTKSLCSSTSSTPIKVYTFCVKWKEPGIIALQGTWLFQMFT